MKKILHASLFILFVSSVFAQKVEYQNHHDIVHFERMNKEKLINFEKTNVGNMYDLKYHRFDWTIDPSVDFISGAVTTYFTAKENNLTEITFDLLTELTVDSIDYGDENLVFEHANNVLSVTLPGALSLNQLDSLTIWYHGVPSEGSGFGSFIQSEHNGHPIIWTLSEPYGARDWWPCKQNLVDKIDSIDVIVTTPSPNRVASNGLLIAEIEQGENTVFHWRHRHPIPAYLIAISVTNYVYYSDYVEVDDETTIEVLNYVFPEDLAYAQSNSVDIIQIMEFFNEKFMLYPYADEKYGHAQFGWGGGMEHQTMSFMGGFGYGLMAHELAHQWFGNYITCGSWEDIWINEGFATYLNGLCYEEFPETNPYGTWRGYKQAMTNSIISEPDGSVLCDDTTNVWRIFNGRLSYNKGAMVLHMLRHELGDEVFFNALQNYLHDPDLINGYAVTEDLKAHLEAAADTNLTEFFSDWYAGEGYPTYQLTWYQDENHVINLNIEQQQSHSSVSYFEMHVPILLEGYYKDSLVLVHNTENNQQFSFELSYQVVNVKLDQEADIVKGETDVVVGLKQPEAVQTLDVYPNPASEILNIHLKNPDFGGKIELFDLYGKKVKTITTEKGIQTLSLDISNLNGGIYFISNAGNMVNRKIIIR